MIEIFTNLLSFMSFAKKFYLLHSSKYLPLTINYFCGVMVKALAFRLVDRWFDPGRRTFAENCEYFMIFVVYLAPDPGETELRSYNNSDSTTPYGMYCHLMMTKDH